MNIVVIGLERIKLDMKRRFFPQGHTIIVSDIAINVDKGEKQAIFISSCKVYE